jgi:hypothetical protein
MVYRSVAIDNINLSDIQDILNEARDFNPKNDITGCLLFLTVNLSRFWKLERKE